MNELNDNTNLLPETSTKTNYNRQLQKYLREMSFAYDSIPIISVDGVAGEETEAALKAFQEIVGLEATGIADPVTWDLLYKNYLNYVNNKLPQIGFQAFSFDNDIYNPGDSHPGIYSVQHIFLSLSEEYVNFIKPEFTGIIDNITAENIREFRRISMLPEGTYLDSELWNILASAHNFLTRN